MMYGEFEAGLVRQLAEVTAERDALQERLVTLQRILSGVKEQRDALQGEIDRLTVERDALRADVPKWWNCDTHGDQQHAWGCPECVRELRTQNAALRDHLKKANSQTEEFERKWYLVGDERDALRAFAREAIDSLGSDTFEKDTIEAALLVEDGSDDPWPDSLLRTSLLDQGAADMNIPMTIEDVMCSVTLDKWADTKAAIEAYAAEQVAVECNSTDNLLTLLGLAPEQCRTDGGSLNPRKVMTLLNERRRPKGGAWADRKDGFWLGDDAAIRARAQEQT